METRHSHAPKFLQESVKESNSILSKTNIELTALSGSSGYGNAKPDMEVEIRSAQSLDGSSLQLRGEIQVEGPKDAEYDGVLNFNGSAYSLIPQITIEYNGNPYLMLTQDADYVASLHRKTHSSNTEYENDDVLSLANVNINPATGSHSFVLDLAKYGSVLNYYLATSPVASLKIRIHFQKNLARLFHGAESAGKSVSGYKLNNVRLCGDFMSLSSNAEQILLKQLQSAKGLHMLTHSYIPSRNTLLDSAGNHRIQGSYQYRNLVSVFYLPVPTSITPNASGISTNDVIDILQFQNEKYPKEFRVRMAGMEYVNQNGPSGCSQKMEHLTGVLKACRETPADTNVGYEICQGYKDETYQVLGASFVRGNDNLVAITNSGANGYATRGILETEFATGDGQTNKTLLTVGVITTSVKVENGQVSVLK